MHLISLVYHSRLFVVLFPKLLTECDGLVTIPFALHSGGPSFMTQPGDAKPRLKLFLVFLSSLLPACWG
jgi:hypothetical protein